MSLDGLWTVSGLSLDCLWTISGLSLDCLWTVSGLQDSRDRHWLLFFVQITTQSFADLEKRQGEPGEAKSFSATFWGSNSFHIMITIRYSPISRHTSSSCIGQFYPFEPKTRRQSCTVLHLFITAENWKIFFRAKYLQSKTNYICLDNNKKSTNNNQHK